MRLLIGRPDVIIPVVTSYGRPCFLYNIGSMFMQKGIEYLSNLTPSSRMINVSSMNLLDERQFDIQYANYLVSNEAAFVDIMKIIYNLYSGFDVFCISDIGDESNELFVESILKYIQQRYGFNGQILGDVEDFQYTVDSTFTIQGLYNLDLDKERFAMLCQNFGSQ